jgi:hypothetical protein
MAAGQTANPKEGTSWYLGGGPYKVSSWQLNRQWIPKKLVWQLDRQWTLKKLVNGSMSNFYYFVKYCTCITALIAKSPNMHLGLIIIAKHIMQILTFTLIYLQLDRTKALRQ